MRTKEDILKDKPCYDIGNGEKFYHVDNVIEFMQQYAEEYHRAELLKLNKSNVISSVCKCKGGAVGRTVTADFEHQICDRCGNIAK